MAILAIKDVVDVINATKFIEKKALEIVPNEIYAIEDKHVQNVIKASFVKVGTDVIMLAEVIRTLAKNVQELEVRLSAKK